MHMFNRLQAPSAYIYINANTDTPFNLVYMHREGSRREATTKKRCARYIRVHIENVDVGIRAKCSSYRSAHIWWLGFDVCRRITPSARAKVDLIFIENFAPQK